MVTPPISSQGSGGGGGRRVSFEQADRLRKQLREIETQRRKKWAKPKEFERQIEQIYRDLYESPYRDELPALVDKAQIITAQADQVNKPDYSTLLKDMSATLRLLDLYQTYLDDEEAIALLLLL